jgi:hypothetical protein
VAGVSIGSFIHAMYDSGKYFEGVDWKRNFKAVLSIIA